MTTPLAQLLGSLDGRTRSGRTRFLVPGSRSVLALVSALRGTGSLVGFRRRVCRRVELVVRPGLPSPAPPVPPVLRSRRGLFSLPPSALVSSSAGLRSPGQLRRRRSGGTPLLLPFGR